MPWHNVLLFFGQQFYATDSASRNSRLILGFIKPVTDYFKVRDLLKSFHFFYEGDRLELRLELGDGVSRDEVKSIFRKYLAKVIDLVDAAKSDIVNYQPEVRDDQFGVDGWEIAKKVFEYGSKLAIAVRDVEFRKGKLLHEGKLIHCMLDSVGYDWRRERDFHIMEAIEREIVIMSHGRGMKPEDVNVEQAKQHIRDHMDKLKIEIAK